MNKQDGMSRLGGASQKQTEVAVLAAGCFWVSKMILPDCQQRSSRALL
jgi:hypothetical protein